MKRLWLVFAQAVTVLLAAYFVVLVLKPQWLAGAWPGTHRGNTVTVIEAPAPEPTQAPAASVTPHESLSGAVRRAAPAVVSINTTKLVRSPFADSPLFRYFFGDPGEQQQSGLGSGVIMSPDGYVLTNNHVVQEADAIEVVLADARSASAEIVGTDPDSDLAVLKITLRQLPVIVMGDSDQLQVGDRVLAIGNPFGVGQTVTAGIVSALGRNHLGLNAFENFIQTDAAINLGNSGGALTDASGNLVGINSAIYSRTGDNLGIGFAIPVNTARRVLESIIRDGRVVRGWIGAELEELTPELAQAVGSNAGHGVIVKGILNGGPAWRAGLRPGDVITALAGQPVTTAAQLLSSISELKPGIPAEFSVQRGTAMSEVQVTPVQRPTPRR